MTPWSMSVGSLQVKPKKKKVAPKIVIPRLAPAPKKKSAEKARFKATAQSVLKEVVLVLGSLRNEKRLARRAEQLLERLEQV